MAEIIPRIGVAGGVELTLDGAKTIEGAPFMSPNEAAFLARGLLSGAAALVCPNPPPSGSLCGDAHLPPISWVVGHSEITGDPVLILSIPPGIALTFVMSSEGAKAIGDALVIQSQKSKRPEDRRGKAH